MLHRVAVGQPRFNLPGLTTDARGGAMGRQLVARFGAVDRLVAFLRVLSADESLDDLQPGFRIVYARSDAGTREAIVVMPAASQELGEAAARAARLARGQLFTGAGKHFVQFRDAQAPLGYDVDTVTDAEGDLILYGVEQTVPYRVESELPLAKLLLRLSLARVHGRAPAAPEGPIYVTARRGLGPVIAEYLHRVAGRSHAAGPGEGGGAASGIADRSRGAGAGPAAGRHALGDTTLSVDGASEPLRASAALCDTSATSAFSPGATFWLFRIERVTARLYRLLRTTPGVEVYLPVTNHVAVAAGFRHPIHLESCRGSFAADRLHLFSPRGVVEVAPLPALAAIEDLVRIVPPPPERAELRAAVPGGRADLTVPLRLEPGGGAGRAVAALIPWAQATWLQRLVYALPPSVLRAYRVALLKRGILIRATEAMEGMPFGTLLQLGAPEVLIPLGTRLAPAVSPAILAERLGAIGGALVLYAELAAPPLRVLAEAIVPLERRLLAELEPAVANLEALGRHERPVEEPVVIENEPLGPMPLWGLGRP
ncbi:MAG TPA: hypothetical protein VMT03_08805 [Polyangia bacterium]|nr:hypothetical protein [Polyangia bacterium]